MESGDKYRLKEVVHPGGVMRTKLYYFTSSGSGSSAVGKPWLTGKAVRLKFPATSA